jgi:MFS transporter, DHA1 family, tetracycline resistance protein
VNRIAAGVIFATILLDFLGFSILIPVLPRHLLAFGASTFEVGLILALYMIALVLFLPFWGWIADRIGRKPVIVACLLGSAVSFALMAWADSLWMFYLARVLQGFFGTSVGAAQAYITDITSDDERTGGIGMMYAAASAGIVFGPAIGGLLYPVHPTLPFYAPAALAALACLGAALFLPESWPTRTVDTGWRNLLLVAVPTPLRILVGIHDNRTRAYLYLFLHFFAAFAALEAMFPLFASSRFGFAEWEVGLFLSFLGVALAITQGLLVGRLERAFGDVPLVIAGLALTGACMVGMSEAPSVALLLVLGLGAAVGNGLALPAFTSLFSKHCGRQDEKGEFLAHSQAMVQTGRGIGFIWGGAAFGALGPGAPFFLGGLGILGGLALFLLAQPLLLPRNAKRAGSATSFS